MSFGKRISISKYNNTKAVCDGIKFDSKKEAGRYSELKMLQASGIIDNLRLQVRFEICPKRYGNKRARFYVADFVYTEGGRKIIEDVKSDVTRKNALYSLKKALVLAHYPDYIFKET